VLGGATALNVAHFIGQLETPAFGDPLARSTLDGFATPSGSRLKAMELFTQLFGDLLAFVYHYFDRIVMCGYLSGLSRPEPVVHFFRNAVGVATVDTEVLSQHTAD
jgi:hypothetical protein